MPTDMQKLSNDKEKIIQTIRIRGPSLPIQIAKSISAQLLFASAYLSELHAEKKILMSHMRVGSSPLYYLPGQEQLLEKFIEHLNNREREAFNLIKQEKILEDEKLEPVMRVALRAINDFAHPIRVRVNEEIKLFWKYLFLKDDEVRELIQEKIGNENPSKNKIEEPKEEAKEPINIPEQKENLEKEAVKNFENPFEKEIEKPIEPQPQNPVYAEQKTEIPENQNKQIQKQPELKTESKIKKEISPEEKKIEINDANKFSRSVKNYLESKNIEIIEVIEEKKKDLSAKIRIDMTFGKLRFFLIAKEKKKISEDDLAIALQKAREELMPALFISTGDLAQKAEEYLKKWQDLIKFEKIKT